jgi:malonate transporter and related proteins
MAARIGCGETLWSRSSSAHWLPILFVVFLGWLAVRMKLFGAQSTTTLSTFVVRFALPLALFLAATLAKARRAHRDAAYIASLAAGLIGTYVLGILLGRFVFKHDVRASALEGLSCSVPLPPFDLGEETTP